MGFSIQPPPPQAINANVNSTQMVLGDPTTITPVALVAGTEQTIIPADTTRELGLVDAVVNPSSTAIIYVAHGRAATTTNYDYAVYSNSSVNDKKLGKELVSAIATASVSVAATYRKYVEV